MSVTDSLRSFWSVESIEAAMHERVIVPPDPAAWDDEERAVLALLKGVYLQPGQTVIDYGCGVGRLTRPLLNRGANVIAADVSPKMLGFTRSYCAGESARLRTLLTDGFGVPEIPAGSVHGAISMYCLQHMPTLDMVKAVLVDLHRVIMPVGWLVLQSTDHGIDERHEVGFIGARQPLVTILNLCDQAGFFPMRVQCPLLEEGCIQYLLTLSRRE